jgi:hypothetical protein
MKKVNQAVMSQHLTPNKGNVNRVIVIGLFIMSSKNSSFYLILFYKDIYIIRFRIFIFCTFGFASYHHSITQTFTDFGSEFLFFVNSVLHHIIIPLLKDI